MSQFIITISDPATENDFLEFVSSHKNVQAKSSPLETNVDIYDENGNFKWVSLVKPGLKVPKEYMEWRFAESEKAYHEGRVKPWKDLREKLISRIK